MPIPVNCQCGQSFRAKDELAGKRVKCPKCGQLLQIPSSAPAAPSGLLSIDDLMKMDAAAPAGGPQNVPAQNMPAGMQPGMPAQFNQAGGFAPPGAGGFQAPNPFFAQPGAAKSKSSGGGDQTFKIAMYALGGVSGLAIIAIVLIFAFRGGSEGNTNVATIPPPNNGAGPGPNPGTTTPNTGTPSTGAPATGTPGKTQGTNPATGTGGTPTNQTFTHPGFDTPDAAFDGYLQAIAKKDTGAVRTMLRDMLGTEWDEMEKLIEGGAKAANLSSNDAWNQICELAKKQLADTIVQRQPPQTQGDRATITLDVKNPLNPQQVVRTQKLIVRDAKGKWHLALEDQERKVVVAMLKTLGGGTGTATPVPPVASGPTLTAGLKQYYADPKDRRGAWLVDLERDQPHMGWGWMSELLPYIGHDDLYQKIDFKKQFYADSNRKLGNTVIQQFLNPADGRLTVKEFSPDRGMAYTHFVGVSGVEDKRQVVAAALPRSDPRAGVFGYERIAKPSEITDGTSNTIMVIGTEMLAPWIEGGGATIRGAREPYFGGVTGSQFGTRGQQGAISLMADGSVRLIPAGIDPKVFRDLCTIHGGDKVDMTPYPLKEDFFTAPPKSSGGKPR